MRRMSPVGNVRSGGVLVREEGKKRETRPMASGGVGAMQVASSLRGNFTGISVP